GGRDPGEDVARARGRERRQAQCAHEDAAAGRSDERVLALEDDDAAEALRRLPDRCETVRGDLLRVAPEQAPELALVWREDARRRPPARLELEERVGVDDRGHFDLGEDAAD